MEPSGIESTAASLKPVASTHKQLPAAVLIWSFYNLLHCSINNKTQVLGENHSRQFRTLTVFTSIVQGGRDVPNVSACTTHSCTKRGYGTSTLRVCQLVRYSCTINIGESTHLNHPTVTLTLDNNTRTENMFFQETTDTQEHIKALQCISESDKSQTRCCPIFGPFCKRVNSVDSRNSRHNQTKSCGKTRQLRYHKRSSCANV